MLKAMDRDPAGATRVRPTSPTTSSGSSTAGRPAMRRLSVIERMARWARRPRPSLVCLPPWPSPSWPPPPSRRIWAPRRARTPGRQRSEREARKAEARAVSSEDEARRQSAVLLLDRGVALASAGQVAEGLHWMLASLRASSDPELHAWPASTGQLVRPHRYAPLLDRHTSPGSGPQPRWPAPRHGRPNRPQPR